jgi:hypothetical protein
MPISSKEIHKQEIEFLEGPRSRWKEFTFSLNVMWEFIRGFRALAFKGPCVTMFGSARFKRGSPILQIGKSHGCRSSQTGIYSHDRGGPGIMEASNRGAKDVNGRSIGCNIILPFEQTPNPYLDSWVDMKYFFVRKVFTGKILLCFYNFSGRVRDHG